MANDETVKLNVTVHVDYDDPEYDTGITVDEWNAMTPQQRRREIQGAWDAAAQSDDGGIWPVTDGAVGDR